MNSLYETGGEFAVHASVSEKMLIEIMVPAIAPHSFEVTVVKWWMGHYGSATPKRHYLYANSHFYSSLDLGPLRKIKNRMGEKQEPPKDKVITVKHYRDKQGKQRWQGTDKLRGTECLNRISI